MFHIDKLPGQKMIDLGGGNNPHPQADVNVDVRQGDRVHFAVNFEEFPWPIADNEWDIVYCGFCLEHLSYRAVPQFLNEVFRITKPGGTVWFLTPNTEAQLKWIQDNQTGWDNKALFEAASEKLFGSQDYRENAHRVFLSPTIVQQLFQKAGFETIITSPFNPRSTDLQISAKKPIAKPIDDPNPDKLGPALAPGSLGMPNIEPTQFRQGERIDLPRDVENPFMVPAVELAVEKSQLASVAQTGQEQRPGKPEGVAIDLGSTTKLVDPKPPEAIYTRQYFDNYTGQGGFYWDFPSHEITFRHVLARRPENVLELGCGRGYIGKRLQDDGIPWIGYDVSTHCYLTRTCDDLHVLDLTTPLNYVGDQRDFCFSISFLEHIPESAIPDLLKGIKGCCKRGLHGITFADQFDGWDKTKITLKSYDWWLELFDKHGLIDTHEIRSAIELEQGSLPPEVLEGDGTRKINAGCYMTMFHRGWINLDVFDHLQEFANQHRYKYQKCDLTQGLPYKTGTVDAIFLAHVLEHFDYKQGLSTLREFRRVIKPSGALRILVPNGRLLCSGYENHALGVYDEVNGGCAEAPTDAAKLYALMMEGHKAIYDADALLYALENSGWEAKQVQFREPGFTNAMANLIVKETIDMHPSLTLYVSAIPKLS